jgi:hypothetical protein
MPARINVAKTVTVFIPIVFPNTNPMATTKATLSEME